MSSLFDDRGAYLSPCRTYRYTLTRRWDDGSALNVIGLNPSTADAATDDPTITRLCRRARRLGYPALIVTNLFAFRATDPREMLCAPDPVGPFNDQTIREVADGAARVVLAWGNHGVRHGRAAHVRWLLSHLHLWCFAVTATGEPAHPLYLRNDLPLTRWNE